MNCSGGRAIAQQAADWSTPRMKLMLTFRVLADNEVKAVDLQNANLLLFGTKETNSVIANYARCIAVGAQCRSCRLWADVSSIRWMVDMSSSIPGCHGGRASIR